MRTTTCGELAGTAARVFRERLEGPADALPAVRWLRGEPRAVALSGAWAGGGLVLTSRPVAVAEQTEDAFELLEASPFEVAGLPEESLVCGGWFGWLGFGLAGTLERIGPPPPRRQPLPRHDIAFHDHVVRCDDEGQWWFEALWTEARAETLRERLQWWRRRLAVPAPEPAPFDASRLRVSSPGTRGHAAAVAQAVEWIWEGELSQVNLCLYLEATLDGHPLDLWLHGVARGQPSYAAYVQGAECAVLSLSPELFLQRRGKDVRSRPIKGTAPSSADPAALRASGKDRAENVMIVDLMRNDLGRVCRYGSVQARNVCDVEPAAGVWHLVSTVEGQLRPGVGDGELLRATFPPGSVTGAPKVQALKMINQLESSAREAYCGAVGMCSPIGGLELNVAIRTFEVRGDTLRLGAGGGIVSDSVPDQEVQEALDKAAGVAEATGLTIDRPPPVGSSPPRAALVRGGRPNPDLGVIETIRVQDGEPAYLAEHLARLRASCEALGTVVPAGIERSIEVAARDTGSMALRIVVWKDGAQTDVRPLPAPGPVSLRPVVLPGGLGAHKWADRSLINSLASPSEAPLFCDLDGTVLEAGHAAVMMLVGEALIAPPLDGRLLPSISREHVLEAARGVGLTSIIARFTLEEASASDGLMLSSALRGPHPGVLFCKAPSERIRALCARLRH